MKNWSDTSHVPVLLGEFGSVKNCDYNSRMKHYRAYVELAQQYGFISCAWDDGGDFRIMERATKKWDEVRDILIHTTSKAPGNLNLVVLQDTMIRLSWSNPSPLPDTFFIEHRTSSGSYSRIATLPGNTTAFTHIKPAVEIYHHYRIIAHYHATGTDLYSQPMRIFLPKYVPKTRSFFMGAPEPIPGTIEAENFDIGGQGFTYHDATEINSGSTYRIQDAVDIYSNNGNGFYVSSILPGEWFEQTVAVDHDGPFLIEFYVGSRISGGKFNLAFGSYETKTFIVPATGNFNLFSKITDTLDLTAGNHIMRFTILDDPYFSIDKMVFTSLSVPSGISSAEEKPFGIRINSHDLSLQINPDAQIQSVSLYNMNGQLIKTISKPAATTNIPISDFKQGIYILKVVTSNESYTNKIPIR